jgi:hypothetical protein
MLERGYDAMRAYSTSKLAQIMFTFELAERLSGTGVSVNALHPASLMDTKMVQDTFGYTMSTVEEGAEATVHLAASPELEGVTGRYFDGTREARADGQAYDKKARQTLWELSEGVCSTLSCDSPDAILPIHPATDEPDSRNVILLRKPPTRGSGASSTTSAPCPSPTPRWAPRATERRQATRSTKCGDDWAWGRRRSRGR